METPDNNATQTADPAAAGNGGVPPTGNAAAASTTITAAAPAAARPAKAGKAAAGQPGKKKAGATGDPEVDEAAKPEANPKTVEIWPLRSYQDAGEIKRRGGPGYTAPKRHADALIARGLATDEQPAKAETDSSK